MALDEVRTLLRYRDTPTEDCGDVNALLDEHIHAVEVRVDELMQLKGHMVVLRQKCASTAPTSSCGILRALSDRSCHRSAERRVGKECVGTCRSWCSTNH